MSEWNYTALLYKQQCSVRILIVYENVDVTAFLPDLQQPI